VTGRRALLRAVGLAGLLPPALRSPTAARSATVASPPDPFPDGSYLLMPLGDSITFGSTADTANGSNGYRKYLHDWLIGPNETHGLRMIGSQISGSAGLAHEGHPGWTIGQLIGLVQGGLFAATMPQFVVLLAGANDFGQGRTADQALADTATLIDLILAPQPWVRVVLCEQILMSGSINHTLTDNTRKQQAYNAALPGLVSSKNGRVVVARSSVIGQDMLDPSGVHPVDVGYRWLAYTIYGALAPWLGQNGWMVNVPVPPGSPRPTWIL
jgi:lysophospholipase L1-like esterase